MIELYDVALNMNDASNKLCPFKYGAKTKMWESEYCEPSMCIAWHNLDGQLGICKLITKISIKIDNN